MENIIIHVEDWSPVTKYSNWKEYIKDSKIDVASKSGESKSKELGLYKYGDEYYTSGYAGIGRLRDSNGKIITCIDKGITKECILQIKPRFKVDQWKMLETVMKDDEFEAYISDKPNEPNKLYEIFYDEKPIKVPVGEKGGELILALSFLKCCQSICKKQLKAQMSFHEDNLNGKIKGKILINKHIKKNVVMGREDRVCCQYPTFTVDTIENRILKNAVIKAEKIIRDVQKQLKEVSGIIHYCKTSLNHVTTVPISKNDFSKVKLTGFNSYYKPAIELAKILLDCGSININSNDDNKKEKMVIPYVIKMEALFEFYIRSKIKEKIKKDKEKYKNIELDKYSGKVLNVYEPKDDKSIYLMKTYIPDIAFIDKSTEGTDKYIAVFDAKYQEQDTNPAKRRNNTHQLLFYTLLLNVKKSGFIFPMKSDKTENERDKKIIAKLKIQKGTRVEANELSDPEYSQWELSDDVAEEDGTENNKMIDDLLNYVIQDY